MDFDKWVIERLRVHGAYGGVVDNVPGRAMIAGLLRFQRSVGLEETGLANKATVDALRAQPSNGKVLAMAPLVPAEPVWMRDARRFMGLKEVAGAKSNPTIISWAKRLGGWVASYFTNDDIPWCGLFVANIMATTLPRELLPKNPLGALEWSKFGIPLPEPILGAIMTFTRTGGGHVGLYVGEDATHYHILGGNQSNSVSITRIDKARLHSIRWPSTGGFPSGGRVRLTSAGVPVSKNEA
ncbi:TIGR02594 family protein [Metarhizobium album]|uniref:TIGR02594 family protein n=1 Tax=Metarhizobium album TaxID=2182425 RepID=A0A2U2DFP0_9HYPH|nr:TIGR02594 family protein [Rhizobium album]PWE52137.1 TIGR02594 family protein [Rhizobium album]